MSQQFINIGYVVNDGTGDTLRDAFEKVNDNFSALFTSTISGTSLATPNTVVRRDEAGGAAFGIIEFKNEYGTPANFPAAASHTGMVAYANSTGKEYYSNGSQWLQLSGAVTTDELPEGSANLFFTNSRARNALNVSGPTWVTYDRINGVLNFADLTASDISGVASESYVDNSIAGVLGDVISSLDTLGELADAVNNDPQFFQTIASGLDAKANINSPELTGVPTAPTADPGTNTTQLATTEFVAAAVAAGALADTDDLLEGATNLYFTEERARNSISGTGDISYNPTTGVITYTGSAGVTSFNDLTDVPTTLSGYGITDAYTITEVDTALSGKVSSSELADYYNKLDVDTMVGAKANASDVYNKTEVYTQQEVDLLIASSLSGGQDTFTKAEVLDLLLNIHNRLNEAGIPDLLGTVTSAVVVSEDWGSVTEPANISNEDLGDLADDVGY